MKRERSNWHPFKLKRQFYDLFKTIFGHRSMGTGLDTGGRPVWSPSADLYREEGRWVARVELPGVNPNDVSVSVANDRLTIQGERKLSVALKSEYCILHECSYGPFKRVITLPDSVPEDQIKAHYRQGILYVTFPAAKKRGERIEIQSEEPPEATTKAA